MSKPVPSGVVSVTELPTIETALLAIPGIRGARVIIDVDGGIGEIHATVSPRRSPKKIVRDIESFLLVRYAYRIDYRRISLVQVSDQAIADRITLGRVTQIERVGESLIEVELLNGEFTYRGCQTLVGDVHEVAARAAIDALNQLFEQPALLDLGGVQLTTFGARQVTTVYVVCQSINEEHVLGTTFVRGNVAEAAARAVLAATNRRLAGWLTDQRQAPAKELAAA